MPPAGFRGRRGATSWPRSRRACKRLKTDWIDLYQQHQPDPLTPIEETLRALDDLVRQGKVRYIGCSTLPAWQVVEAQWTSKHLGLHHFVSCQEEYSLLARDLDRDMMPVLESLRARADPVPPAGGWPPDRQVPARRAAARRHPLGDDGASGGAQLDRRNWAIVERLAGFAAERGHTLLELALSWLLRAPGRGSVIAGATSRNRSNRMSARPHGP